MLTRFLKAQQARFRGRLADVDPEPDFSRAEQLFRELETPFYLAVTLLEHAEWLIKTGPGAEAEPLLADARTTFERLESRPWLERLQRVEPVQQAVLAETS